jgi:hypothetical protein
MGQISSSLISDSIVPQFEIKKSLSRKDVKKVIRNNVALIVTG